MQFQCKKIILAYLHRFSLGCNIRTWDRITTATISTFTSQYLSLPTCIYYREYYANTCFFFGQRFHFISVSDVTLCDITTLEHDDAFG